MIGILAGWVKNRVFYPIFHIHSGDATEIEPEQIPGEAEGFEQASIGLGEHTLTASQAGFRFEFGELERLMRRVRTWDSVRFMKVNGAPINSPADFRRGPDGGVDAIIVISTPTQHGTKVVAGRLRTVIVTQDY